MTFFHINKKNYAWHHKLSRDRRPACHPFNIYKSIIPYTPKFVFFFLPFRILTSKCVYDTLMCAYNLYIHINIFFSRLVSCSHSVFIKHYSFSRASILFFSFRPSFSRSNIQWLKIFQFNQLVCSRCFGRFQEKRSKESKTEKTKCKLQTTFSISSKCDPKNWL